MRARPLAPCATQLVARIDELAPSGSLAPPEVEPATQLAPEGPGPGPGPGAGVGAGGGVGPLRKKKFQSPLWFMVSLLPVVCSWKLATLSVFRQEKEWQFGVLLHLDEAS